MVEWRKTTATVYVRFRREAKRWIVEMVQNRSKVKRELKMLNVDVAVVVFADAFRFGKGRRMTV